MTETVRASILPALPADLEDLVQEVLFQVPRLLALQDRDPDAPTRGCMHPAFWRDKSSEVADMRRQEAALTFAWVWRHGFRGNAWRHDPEILNASLRALGFWTRRQHADGTFDEWYVGEHGYATTAFSCYAVALAVEALGDALAGPLREKVLASLRRGGAWLATHDDWFKTNHQAVGVAALGAVGRLLGDEALLAAARRNARAILDRMHPEGWSREISGLDLGYSFLLAEYLAMHAVLTGETIALEPAKRAYEFAAHFLHPDLTTGAEYGICANPYFSRVATVALSPHLPVAAAALRWMERPSIRPRDTASTLKDDLRLARYAYQPLLAALLATGALERRDAPKAAAPGSDPLFFEQAQATRWFPQARLLAVTRARYAAWAAPAHGGLVRVAFKKAGGGFARPVVDRGFACDAGGRVFRNASYRLSTDATFDEGVLRVEAPLTRCSFVMPPYAARVGLRVATALPWGHRWSRWLIDQWRRRKGTALNQSTGGISGGPPLAMLHREISFEDDRVVIVDRLRAVGRPLPACSCFLVVDGPVRLPGGAAPDADRRIPLAAALPLAGDPFQEVTLRRELGDGGNGEIVLTVSKA